jgi:hypothetical protein
MATLMSTNPDTRFDLHTDEASSVTAQMPAVDGGNVMN